MRTCEEMIVSLQNDEWNEKWESLYLMDGSPVRREWAKQRAIGVIEGFRKRFAPIRMSALRCSAAPDGRSWAATTPTISMAGCFVPAWIWICWLVRHPTG